MNKFDDDEFNMSEYEHGIRMRRKRILIGLIVAAIAVLAIMITFWN